MDGKVTVVSEVPLGTELDDDVVAGATSIPVADINQMDWDDGTLAIAQTEIIDYTVPLAADPDMDDIGLDDDADADEGSLTLAAPLADNYFEGQKVSLYPLSYERVAWVLGDDQEEPVRARIRHSLYDHIPTGTRDELNSETVEISLIDDEWVVTDVIGDSPNIDGSFIEASTLAQIVQNSPADGLDVVGFFSEAWSNPGNAKLSDNTWASALGTGVSGTPVPFTTGYHFPSTEEDSSSVGTLAWTGMSRIEANDNVGAEVDSTNPPQTTHYLKATGYDFDIPAGAVVTGVAVTIRKGNNSSSGGITDNLVKLVKGGVVSGTDHSETGAWKVLTTRFGAEPDVVTYGSTSDLWGLSLTAADVNASDFGVAISANLNWGADPTAWIDSIRVKVSYTVTASVPRTNSHFLSLRDFGFTLPQDATVTGITVQIERHASADSGNNYVTDRDIRLVRGTSASDSKADLATHWPTTDAFKTYGGDLWGLRWTVDDVNDSGFAVWISADISAGETAFVDSVRVTIIYNQSL